MRLLLDTNAFVRAHDSPEKIPDRVRDELSRPANSVYVSVVTAWELCVKTAIGKLELPRFAAVLATDNSFRAFLERARIELLPIELSHVFQTKQLPLHHRDPFDRLLIAQAIVENLTLVSSDRTFVAYGVSLLQT